MLGADDIVEGVVPDVFGSEVDHDHINALAEMNSKLNSPVEEPEQDVHVEDDVDATPGAASESEEHVVPESVHEISADEAILEAEVQNDETEEASEAPETVSEVSVEESSETQDEPVEADVMTVEQPAEDENPVEKSTDSSSEDPSPAEKESQEVADETSTQAKEELVTPDADKQIDETPIQEPIEEIVHDTEVKEIPSEEQPAVPSTPINETDEDSTPAPEETKSTKARPSTPELSQIPTPAASPSLRSVKHGPPMPASAVTGYVRAVNPILDELLHTLALLKENDSSAIVFDFKNSACFTSSHALMLAEALRTNTHVQVVDLSNTRLSNASATELATALEVNTSVTTLNLTGNQIGPSGMRYLAYMLGKNQTLTQLQLSNQKTASPTGTEAEQAFATALAKNTSLVKLNLSIRDVASRDQIERSLRRNQDLARRRRLESQKQ